VADRRGANMGDPGGWPQLQLAATLRAAAAGAAAGAGGKGWRRPSFGPDASEESQRAR